MLGQEPRSLSRHRLPRKATRCACPNPNVVLQCMVEHLWALQTSPCLYLLSRHTTPGDPLPRPVQPRPLQPWLLRLQLQRQVNEVGVKGSPVSMPNDPNGTAWAERAFKTHVHTCSLFHIVSIYFCVVQNVCLQNTLISASQVGSHVQPNAAWKSQSQMLWPKANCKLGQEEWRIII